MRHFSFNSIILCNSPKNGIFFLLLQSNYDLHRSDSLTQQGSLEIYLQIYTYTLEDIICNSLDDSQQRGKYLVLSC